MRVDQPRQHRITTSVEPLRRCRHFTAHRSVSALVNQNVHPITRRRACPVNQPDIGDRFHDCTPSVTGMLPRIHHHLPRLYHQFTRLA